MEYKDMESLGGTDRAMTSKVDREEWMKALRGIKRTFLEQYMNTWFISKRLPSMLRWCIKRGIVVEGLRVQRLQARLAAAEAQAEGDQSLRSM